MAYPVCFLITTLSKAHYEESKLQLISCKQFLSSRLGIATIDSFLVSQYAYPGFVRTSSQLVLIGAYVRVGEGDLGTKIDRDCYGHSLPYAKPAEHGVLLKAILRPIHRLTMNFSATYIPR